MSINQVEEIQALCQSLSSHDSVLVQRAFSLALVAHAGQKRASGEDYIVHPIAVARNLVPLGTDGLIRAAGLLHDVLEDTLVTYCQLYAAFGPDVARLVDGLTQDAVGNKSSDRDIRNRHKLAQAISQDPCVGLIRLADRLDNMRTLDNLSRPKQLRMSRETLLVYVPLAQCYGLTDWRDELMELALAYIAEPKQQLQTIHKPIIKGDNKIRDEFLEEWDSAQWSQQVLSLFNF